MFSVKRIEQNKISEDGWTQQKGGLWLRSKAIETGKKVEFFIYRSFLKKQGIDEREIQKKQCPLCKGLI